MTEQITLPKSGIVLERRDIGYWRASPGCGAWFAFNEFTSDWFRAQAGIVSHEAQSRDECIAWLDARVLELRAALLPPDARELVAKAIFEAEWRDVNREDWPEFVMADFAFEADHVLAALGGQP